MKNYQSRNEILEAIAENEKQNFSNHLTREWAKRHEDVQMDDIHCKFLLDQKLKWLHNGIFDHEDKAFQWMMDMIECFKYSVSLFADMMVRKDCTRVDFFVIFSLFNDSMRGELLDELYSREDGRDAMARNCPFVEKVPRQYQRKIDKQVGNLRRLIKKNPEIVLEHISLMNDSFKDEFVSLVCEPGIANRRIIKLFVSSSDWRDRYTKKFIEYVDEYIDLAIQRIYV